MFLCKNGSYFIIIIGLIIPICVWAQFWGEGSNGLDNPIKAKTFQQFIQHIADIVAQIGGVIAVIFIIYSGYLFVTARGDIEQLKKAKSTFLWTIIGAAVLLGAYVIATAVVNFFENIRSN